MARTTRAKPIRQVKRGKVESGNHKRSTARDRKLTAKNPAKGCPQVVKRITNVGLIGRM